MKVRDSQHHQDVEIFFRVCPKCLRAVPGHSNEHYCINDGERLLEQCPKCQARIGSPYTKHCAKCGHHLSEASEEVRVTVRERH